MLIINNSNRVCIQNSIMIVYENGDTGVYLKVFRKMVCLMQ